nr:hypothetical protein [Tanacetum cinerariifolium]
MNAGEFPEMAPYEEVEDDDDDPEEDPSEEHEPEDDDEDPEEDPNEEHESKGSEETEPFEEDESAIVTPLFVKKTSRHNLGVISKHSHRNI